MTYTNPHAEAKTTNIATAAADQGVLYTMTFVNNSQNSFNFCCYQNDPKFLRSNPKALPAAWFVKQAVHPTTVVKFTWQINYALCWSQSGKISPGIIYDASQSWSVAPDSNVVTLTKEGNSYTFEDQRQVGTNGVYAIQQDNNVVAQDGVGIGISMQVGSDSGALGYSPIYAQPAQPNMMTQFKVTPKYYVAFSESIQPSQILDVTNISNVCEVDYQPGVYSQVVTLDQQNNWSVESTHALNASFTANAAPTSAYDTTRRLLSHH